MGRRNITCVPLISLLVVVLLSPLHCYTGRPAYDPWIVCVPPVPPQEAGWPDNYQVSDYSNTLDLCSAYWSLQRNMGCICTSSAGAPDCGHGAPEDLLEANLDPHYADGETTFIGFCLKRCFCEPEAGATADRKVLLDEGSGDQILMDIVEGQMVGTQHFTINSNLSVTWHLQDGDHTVDVFGLTHSNNYSNATNGGITSVANYSTKAIGSPSTPDDTCGAACNSTSDCSSSSDCTCQTQSEQYVPSSGTVLFIAFCIVSSLGGGKRDESSPCPCNSTYVSYGCCGVDDGMVWEDPRAKLGEMARLEL